MSNKIHEETFYTSEEGKTIHLTIGELTAREFENAAKRIRGMKWSTYDLYKFDSNKTCPICGSDNLDID
jgi:hypothetical protein